MDNNLDIFSYVASETANYKTNKVPLGDNWEWCMYDHIQNSFMYKHSKRLEGSNDTYEVPFNNVIRPILNLQYRTEGFNVVDVVPYVDSAKDYHKSFLVKKFYPRFAIKHQLDNSIDKSVESYTDYGLTIVKLVDDIAPEVVPLQRIAFCDTTDVLSGAFCERHQLSISQLREMAEAGWNKDSIELLIAKSQQERKSDRNDKQKTKTPGKYIEVYELHGTFPESWLKEDGDPEKYVDQVHLLSITENNNSKNKKSDGITLFKEREPKKIYKALKRDDIFGRACGFGGVEELFDQQVWVNYSELKIKEMLDNASLVLHQTTDEAFASRNNISSANDIESGQILTHDEGGQLTQVANNIPNITAFTNNVVRFEEKARALGSVSDVSLGQSPKSGTPFALQQLVTNEGQGLHEYRKDKISRFWEEIHREWIMESLVKEINKGQKFLDELTLDELESIGELMATNRTNKKIKEKMFAGRTTSVEERDLMKEIVKESFKKGGQKKFIELMKDEVKKIPVDVKINVAGRQKQLALITDKLVNIFRQIIATPDILKAPGMANLFNEIVEASGLNPINFAEFTKVNPLQEPTQGKPQGSTQPIKELQANNQEK